MKSVFSSLFLLFVLVNLHAQSADSLLQKNGICVNASKMNVLYMGVDNPVEVYAAGRSADDLLLDLEGGSLQKTTTGHYTARVNAVGNCTLVVSQNVAGTKLVLGKYTFKAKRLPDPQATLGGMLRGGKAPVEKILSMKSVVPMLLLFEFDAEFQVKSFSVSLISNGKISSAGTKGSVFSKEMKELIGSAKTGDMLLVQDIMVEWPDKSSKEINAVVIKVE
ncbi:MAG: GldM family protein [Chitinophagales bacterium]